MVRDAFLKRMFRPVHHSRSDVPLQEAIQTGAAQRRRGEDVLGQPPVASMEAIRGGPALQSVGMRHGDPLPMHIGGGCEETDHTWFHPCGRNTDSAG